jgi:hypothetical protein
MNTGDEPSLPQPADDNAPMISGRGTKIIADARGAYLAGNLDALIKRMNEAQRQRYRVTLVNLALHYLEELPPRLRERNEATACISAIKTWLDQPTEVNRDAINPTLESAGIIRRFSGQDRYFTQGSFHWTLGLVSSLVILPDLALVSRRTEIAVKVLVQTKGRRKKIAERILSPNLRKLRKTMKTWFLETAWAILQGKEPPPFELPS